MYLTRESYSEFRPREDPADSAPQGDHLVNTNQPSNSPGPDLASAWGDPHLPQFAALFSEAWQHLERLEILIPRETKATVIGNIRQWIMDHVINRPLSPAVATEIATNLQQALKLLAKVSATEADRSWLERRLIGLHRYGVTEVEQHVGELQTACEAVLDAILNRVPMFAVKMDGQEIPTPINAVAAIHDLGVFTHKVVVEAQITLAQATLPNGQGIDLILLKYLMSDLVRVVSKIAVTCAHVKEHLRRSAAPAA
jgi:hypothetical protein